MTGILLDTCDINYEDYHWGNLTLHHPPHPGEVIREFCADPPNINVGCGVISHRVEKDVLFKSEPLFAEQMIAGAQAMTYNFDPDRWYENELGAIRAKHRRGEISEEKLEEEIQELDRKYDEMWKRLDGSYQIPG